MPPGQPLAAPPGAPPAWAQQQWGQQNAPWGAPASKPGVIPLRPLAVGEVLDGAFTVMRHYPKVTLGLAAIVVTISNLIQVAWVASAFLGDSVDIDVTVFATGTAVGVIATAISNQILAGLLTSVMGEAVLGREATMGGTWRKVRPRFWALLGAGLIGGVVPFLALVLLAIPGIFLWGAFALVTPALILERAGVTEAVRRSWRLAVPDWWRVWGIRALGFIVSFVLAFIIAYPGQMVAGLVADGGGENAGAIALLVLFLSQVIARTVTAPFDAGVVSLLYIDRRMRAEGLDVTLAQAAAAEAGRF
jgi:hypothetical protein